MDSSNSGCQAKICVGMAYGLSKNHFKGPVCLIIWPHAKLEIMIWTILPCYCCFCFPENWWELVEAARDLNSFHWLPKQWLKQRELIREEAESEAADHECKHCSCQTCSCCDEDSSLESHNCEVFSPDSACGSRLLRDVAGWNWLEIRENCGLLRNDASPGLKSNCEHLIQCLNDDFASWSGFCAPYYNL